MQTTLSPSSGYVAAYYAHDEDDPDSLWSFTIRHRVLTTIASTGRSHWIITNSFDQYSGTYANRVAAAKAARIVMARLERGETPPRVQR